MRKHRTCRHVAMSTCSYINGLWSCPHVMRRSSMKTVSIMGSPDDLFKTARQQGSQVATAPRCDTEKGGMGIAVGWRLASMRRADRQPRHLLISFIFGLACGFEQIVW